MPLFKSWKGKGKTRKFSTSPLFPCPLGSFLVCYFGCVCVRLLSLCGARYTPPIFTISFQYFHSLFQHWFSGGEQWTLAIKRMDAMRWCFQIPYHTTIFHWFSRKVAHELYQIFRSSSLLLCRSLDCLLLDFKWSLINISCFYFPSILSS